MTGKAYYTLQQATKILQISESTIRKGMKNGEIPREKFLRKGFNPGMVYQSRI